MTKDDYSLTQARELKPRPFVSKAVVISIMLAGLPGLFYLNGKAFYEGYLSYLNLNVSMFPQDASATMMSSVMAWFSATTGGLSGITNFLNQYWSWTLIVVLVTTLVIGTLKWGLKKLATKIEGKQFNNKLPPSIQSWLKDVATVGMLIYLPSYGIFLLMFLVAILLISTIIPFLHLGKEYAAEQLEKGFTNAPLVRAVDPDGATAEYRIVECSDRFCALYLQGQIVAVPLSSIHWAVSNIREKTTEKY